MAKLKGGYILLSRKLVESEIWDKPPLYLKVWIYILTKAQHKPYKKFDRGELLVSIPELVEVCSYKIGYRTEKPTKSQIFNILEWLRRTDEGVNEDNTNETMIATTKTTRGIVVKVTNYDVYQDPKSYEHNGDSNNEELTKATMPKRQANTINKNDKNDKNDKNERNNTYQDSHLEWAKILQSKILDLNPDNKCSTANLKKWANDIRLLQERDKRSDEELHKIIEYIFTKDEFWNQIIQSPASLRKHWDKIWPKVNQNKGTVENIKEWLNER